MNDKGLLQKEKDGLHPVFELGLHNFHLDDGIVHSKEIHRTGTKHRC